MAVAPTVDPRQHRLMIHGMVERPMLLTMEDIERFPSVSRIHFIECPGQRRHGVARGAAQFAAIHPWHGQLRRMDGRQVFDAAGRGRHQERSQMGAGGGRRWRAHGPAAYRSRNVWTIFSLFRHRTAKRCVPSRASLCVLSFQAGKATYRSSGYAASSWAISPGTPVKRRRNTPN